MSAASPATSQVRRTAAPAPSPSRPAPNPQAAARPATRAPQSTAAFVEVDEEIRINLADIPRQQESMDVEGFKPSLFSRLLDLVSPLK